MVIMGVSGWEALKISVDADTMFTYGGDGFCVCSVPGGTNRTKAFGGTCIYTQYVYVSL